MGHTHGPAPPGHRQREVAEILDIPVCISDTWCVPAPSHVEPYWR